MLMKLTTGLSDDELSKFPNVFHQAWHHGRKKHGGAESLLEESTGKLLESCISLLNGSLPTERFTDLDKLNFPIVVWL